MCNIHCIYAINAHWINDLIHKTLLTRTKIVFITSWNHFLFSIFFFCSDDVENWWHVVIYDQIYKSYIIEKEKFIYLPHGWWSGGCNDVDAPITRNTPCPIYFRPYRMTFFDIDSLKFWSCSLQIFNWLNTDSLSFTTTQTFIDSLYGRYIDSYMYICISSLIIIFHWFTVVWT